MSLQTQPQASWQKNNFSTHYPYRDFESATISGVPTTYTIGTNARAVAAGNWPAVGDWSEALYTYARIITLNCTTDVIVIFTGGNPRYLNLIGVYTLQERTVAAAIARLAAEGISPTLTEVPMTLRGGNAYTFNPTHLAAVTYYHPTETGTLDIYIEGSQDGGE